MVPNVPEAQRHTEPVRLLKASRPLSNQVKHILQESRGGTWSRAQAVHFVLQQWLALHKGEVPR